MCQCGHCDACVEGIPEPQNPNTNLGKAMPPLDEIKARAAAATPGPWYSHHNEDRTIRAGFCRWFTCSEVEEQYKKYVGDIEDDCKFIAHARTDIPVLIELVEAKTEENARQKAALEKATAALEIYGDTSCWSTQYISGGLTGECFSTPDTFGCDKARQALAAIEAILKGET